MIGTLPIKSSETLLGFASRYAFYRGVRLPDLMRHTGIKIWHYASFETAVSRLAKMSGNDADLLAFHSLRIQEESKFHLLRGQLINRRDVSREAARYCPRCVKEDYELGGSRPISNVYCRASWMNGRLTVCPEHEIDIVSISKQYSGYAREDFTSALMDNWSEVVAAEKSAVRSEASGYDRYFCARLDGQATTNEVLDDLPYYGALRVCEIVGAMEIGGDRVGRSKLSFDELQRMSRIGFDILRPGYGALRGFLEKRDHRRQESDDKGIGKQLYGILYMYLHDHNETPEFAPIVNFVRNHAFGAHSLGPENNFLGRGGDRKFHSIRSASLEYGIHPATLRKMLRAAGLLAADTKVRDLKVSIDVNAMDELAGRWKDGVPMVYVRERLDASPQVVRQLLEAGFLEATEREIGHKLKKFFSSKQIEGFISQLEELAEVDGDAADMVPLKHCAPFMLYVDIIRGIIDGQFALGISKPPGEPTNLSHLRVDVSAVRQAAGKVVPLGYYSASETTTRMAAKIATVRYLVEKGVLETITYRGANAALATAYSMHSVRTFLDRHITFRKLARGRENWAKTELRVAQIEPVYDLGGPERIYRRSDLGY
ncbi:TniQ family protein [Ensifer adhaerens]|uniref:TniQ family protein n=1 Tax=Ensifer adhaerens TaxID=106592 RepID=UPI003F839813